MFLSHSQQLSQVVGRVGGATGVVGVVQQDGCRAAIDLALQVLKIYLPVALRLHSCSEKKKKQQVCEVRSYESRSLHSPWFLAKI